ncbi:MAG: hypothetical protein MUF37_00995 [Methanoregulaceae archaeon]|nr:hypothetical protein [Methanoregulaceae archaeon]
MVSSWPVLVEIENPLDKHDNFIVVGEIGWIGGLIVNVSTGSQSQYA